MNEVSHAELRKYEEQYGTDCSIGSVTPTVCALMGVPEPDVCGAEPLAAVVDQAQRLNGGEQKVERVLIFCADAVGEIHRQKHPDLLSRVEKLAGMRFSAACVMPSVTPVCFATIFSGSSPEIHSIKKYEKKLLTIPTLFDTLAAAGKNVAILSINTCSVDTIFRNRNVDYYSLRSDAGVFEATRRILADDRYDVIVTYYTDFDAKSHKLGPEHPETLGILEKIVEYFEQLVAGTEEYWKTKKRAVIWVADHGNHIIEDGKGTHGFNCMEDMVVNHFYRVRAAE